MAGIGVGPVSIPAPRIPPVVPWVVGFLGATVVYAALRNESPMGLIRAVIRGEDRTSSAPLDPGRNFSGSGGAFVETPEGDPDAGGGGGFGARGPDDTGPPVSDLTNPDGSTFQLRPDAALAFGAWQVLFQARIPVTTGYRSYASQEASYKSDPGRFAPPGSSKHVKGIAVDVDQNWINSLGVAGQTRLRTTAKAAGWGQARYKRGEAACGAAPSGKSSDNDEPWHFSYRECG